MAFLEVLVKRTSRGACPSDALMVNRASGAGAMGVGDTGVTTGVGVGSGMEPGGVVVGVGGTGVVTGVGVGPVAEMREPTGANTARIIFDPSISSVSSELMPDRARSQRANSQPSSAKECFEPHFRLLGYLLYGFVLLQKKILPPQC